MSLFRRRSSLFGSDPVVGGGRRTFLLTPPSMIAFVISAVLALIAVLMRYADVDVPIINARYLFELVLIAYAILALSVLVGGRGRF